MFNGLTSLEPRMRGKDNLDFFIGIRF